MNNTAQRSGPVEPDP